jgi:hypothetical protein
MGGVASEFIEREEFQSWAFSQERMIKNERVDVCVCVYYTHTQRERGT